LLTLRYCDGKMEVVIEIVIWYYKWIIICKTFYETL
jgi:hypothetical protein